MQSGSIWALWFKTLVPSGSFGSEPWFYQGSLIETTLTGSTAWLLGYCNPIFTWYKNLIPNTNSTAVNRNSPSKFSSFYNCVKGGNAAAARLFNKNSRGYPQIFPCNARK